MTPVAPNSYYAGVVAAFEAGRIDRSKYRKNQPEGLTDVVDTNNVIDEAVEERMTSHEISKPHVTEKESNTAEKVDDKKNTSNGNKDEDVVLTVRGSKTIKKGFYVFEGTDEQGNAISLMFRKDDAEKLNWFADFENAAAVGDTKLKIKGEKRDNYILYKGPAKK